MGLVREPRDMRSGRRGTVGRNQAELFASVRQCERQGCVCVCTCTCACVCVCVSRGCSLARLSLPGHIFPTLILKLFCLSSYLA